MEHGQIKASGNRGELRAGGRIAILGGRWSLETVGGGGWILEFHQLLESDSYILDLADKFTLRLEAGPERWYWPQVELLGMHPVTIKGSGSPERERVNGSQSLR